MTDDRFQYPGGGWIHQGNGAGISHEPQAGCSLICDQVGKLVPGFGRIHLWNPDFHGPTISPPMSLGNPPGESRLGLTAGKGLAYPARP